MDDLKRKTIVGFAQLVLILGLVLFGPAWTFDFWQAWIYLLIFFGAAALITIYLWNQDPQLLERRINAGPTAETETSQKIIQLIAAITFIGLLVVPALDHRYGWSAVPVPLEIFGDFLVALGFYIVFVVFRENTFTAAVIEVAADQKVISTGPYAIVRHPMYSGALIMLFGTPLALGSWWGLSMSVAITLAILWRLRDEEKFLALNLPGYSEYRQKVRYRLVPSLF